MNTLIIMLLFINAGYHVNKQTNARRYRLHQFDLALLKLSSAGYVVINIIFIGLILLF